MTTLQIAQQIQTILENEFSINSLLKGSCGYGIPSEISDVDIQLKLDSLDKWELIKSHFDANELNPVKIIDNDGNEFTSYMLVFKQDNVEVSLLYDDNPKVYELVEMVLASIVDLPLEQKYILRLVGGSYKYMGKDAYKTLLEIFAKLSPILKTNLIEDAKAGKLINEDSARIIRKSVQALFVNETDCKYPRKLL